MPNRRLSRPISTESRLVSADLPAHKDLRTTPTGRGTHRDWFNLKLQSRDDCRLSGQNRIFGDYSRVGGHSPGMPKHQLIRQALLRLQPSNTVERWRLQQLVIGLGH